MMLEFAERWNLVVLNADERCEGVSTRVQGNERSVIDFYLVNERMYGMFERMKVDEHKEMFDMSDHCYLEAGFGVEGERMNSKVNEYEWREYFKVKDGNAMGNFVKGVEGGRRSD